MKHFSKFSSFMRVLAMVLTIVLVAGMVGTNKADADDNSSNVIEDLSSKIQIKKQPVNYTYLNKGSEGQDFAPVFPLMLKSRSCRVRIIMPSASGR